MQLGLCPQYVTDLLPPLVSPDVILCGWLGSKHQLTNQLIPPLVSARNPYHRRRPLEREVPSCKTELLRKSFIFSTSTEWNSLPVYVQQTTSLSVFKPLLCSSDNNVPAYYYIGDRITHVGHCRLRLQMSNLNMTCLLVVYALTPNVLVATLKKQLNTLSSIALDITPFAQPQSLLYPPIRLI